jgi:hypothetical protein
MSGYRGFWSLGICVVTAALGAGTAAAATSFSNSLTGFTGDSTQTNTQNAVTAAGFSFFSIEGFDGIDQDPTVVFDANGARFGTLFAGDGGRNYMRTVEEDYATVNFVAEITIVVPDLAFQDSFFGLGAGDKALFGWPDWSTQFSSVMATPEINDSSESLLTTMYTDNDTPIFANNAVTMTGGTHRLRLLFETAGATGTALFSIDLNYAGGPFTSDFSAPAIDVSGLYGEDGWPLEPSRIFFGADDGTIIKDFSVLVQEPGGAADFDDDGDTDGADFLTWQRGLGTADNAVKAMGDANGDMDVNGADLEVWRGEFGSTGGAASAVPETSSMVLAAAALTALAGSRRRR